MNNMTFLIQEFVDNATQSRLRDFSDIHWNNVSDWQKKRIANRYSFSPKDLIDTPGFTYEEFATRLNTFLDEVTKTRTSYGIIEARGNRWLDIFPISITWEDLGGQDQVAGTPVDKIFIE